MKAKFFLPLVLLATLSVGFTSCSDDDGDNDPKAAIVGKWDGTISISGALFCWTYEFRDDGTAIATEAACPDNRINKRTYTVIDKNNGTIQSGPSTPIPYRIEGDKLYFGDDMQYLTKRPNGQQFVFPASTLLGTWSIKYVQRGEELIDAAKAGLTAEITFRPDGTYEAKSEVLGDGEGTYDGDGFKIETFVDGSRYLSYVVYRISEKMADMLIYNHKTNKRVANVRVEKK